MRITEFVHLKKRRGNRSAIDSAIVEVRSAIKRVVWPPTNNKFVINPDVNKHKKKSTKSGKKGVHLNGVKPIQSRFTEQLSAFPGWDFSRRMKASEENKRVSIFDARKNLKEGLFGLEWETGNISSSHRSLNRMVLSCLRGEGCGGVLILPDSKLYPFLTDRVGNFDELKMYFPVWEAHQINMELIVIAVSYDGLDETVPYIPRGKDGNAARGLE
jgi:hypothetical protein